MPTTVYHLPRARCTSIYFVAMLFVNAVDCRRHLSSSLSVSTQQSFLLNFDNRLVSEFASFDRCNIQTFQKLVAARSTQINWILAIFLIYRMSSRYPPSSTHFHGLPYLLRRQFRLQHRTLLQIFRLISKFSPHSTGTLHHSLLHTLLSVVLCCELWDVRRVMYSDRSGTVF